MPHNGDGADTLRITGLFSAQICTFVQVRAAAAHVTPRLQNTAGQAYSWRGEGRGRGRRATRWWKLITDPACVLLQRVMPCLTNTKHQYTLWCKETSLPLLHTPRHTCTTQHSISKLSNNMFVSRSNDEAEQASSRLALSDAPASYRLMLVLASHC